jgi:purine catabolism regulator
MERLVGLNLQTVLEHPGLARCSPKVLTGNPRTRTVRWVHSSDIYEIAPLLHGGELLLTTGLGLTTVGPEERRAYVRALADKEVAGLALELTRCFTEVPDEMVAEAERLDLPLVALRTVHPFVDVTEQINSDILESSIVRLRHSEEVGRALSRVLAERGGLETLTAALAELLRRPVALTDALGSVLAASTGDLEIVASAAAMAMVRVNGALVGELSIGDGESDEQLVAAAVDRAPEFFAIEMLRSGQQTILVANERRDVLTSLLAGTPEAPAALTAHASTSRIRPESGWVGLAIAADPRLGVEVARDLARRCGLHIVAAEVNGKAYGLLACPPRAHHDEIVARIDHALPPTGPLVAVGPMVTTAAAGRSLRAADQALAVKPDPSPGAPSAGRLLRAQALVVERLLAAVPDAMLLRDLVDEELGALLRAPNAEALVKTLEAYLDNGCCKAATARALHLRRQSVHQRLSRASAWLERDVTAPERQAGLRLALAARHALARSSGAGK